MTRPDHTIVVNIGATNEDPWRGYQSHSLRKALRKLLVKLIA